MGRNAPQFCAIVPPGLNLQRAEGVGRRFARGEPVPSARTTELDVVKVRVTSPRKRVVVGSIPTRHFGACSSTDRAPTVLWPIVPVQHFWNASRKEKAVGSDLKQFFGRMGARVRIRDGVAIPSRWNSIQRQAESPRIVLDIRRDRGGEYFEIQTAAGGQDILVLDARPRERHLLLLSRQFDGRGRAVAKQKFLCGYEERHWFVAAIPESEPVSTVAGAIMALKPKEVRAREIVAGLRRKEMFRRKNVAFIRQGEWFFVPAPGFSVDRLHILRNERLSRGAGGKPHIAEECFRSGGETVYVSARYPMGLTAGEYNNIPDWERGGGFRSMVRDAEVYARGEVWHPDHKRVVLNCWHRVFMNTENRSRAMRFLAFLD
jgi:hypothetical protein